MPSTTRAATFFKPRTAETQELRLPNPWNQTIGGNQGDGGVTWKNMGPASTSPATAIFDPGLYYVGAGGLQPGSNTTMRMSTCCRGWHERGDVLFQYQCRHTFGWKQYRQVHRMYVRQPWDGQPQQLRGFLQADRRRAARRDLARIAMPGRPCESVTGSDCDGREHPVRPLHGDVRFV